MRWRYRKLDFQCITGKAHLVEKYSSITGGAIGGRSCRSLEIAVGGFRGIPWDTDIVSFDSLQR